MRLISEVKVEYEQLRLLEKTSKAKIVKEM